MQVRVTLTLMMLMMSDGLNSLLGPLVLAAAAPVYTPGPGPAGRGLLETPKRKPNWRQQTTEDGGDQRPSNEELTTYLERFGYLQRINHSKYEHSERDVKSAIRHLQRFGRINETGSWNRETAELFRRPRCGLPDEPSVEGDRGSGRRRRRYTTTGGKWSKNELKYRIVAYSSKVKPGAFQSALQNAFDRWSDVIPLTFRQTFNWLEADIELAFARLNHGDGYPFDGPGGVLSHTFSPEDGRMHFDDDEAWTIGYTDDWGIDLNQVVLHEIGHVFGLGHSNYPGALMNPYYPGYQQDIQLTQDDISGAQAIYGVASGYVPPENNNEPSSSSSTTSSSTTTTVTTTTTAEESPTSITSSTTTSSSSSSSSSPVAAAAVMTPKLEPRLTPAGMTPRVTAVRVTPRRS